MKAIVIFAFVVVSLPALAGDCSVFTGNYILSPAGCVSGKPGQMANDLQWTRLSIAYKSSTQKLITAYNPHTGGFVATYIADGKEQKGDDMNNGARYTAGCEGNKLSIRRKFSQIKLPMLTTVTAHDGIFEHVESYEGDDWSRVCKFIQVPN